MIVFKAFLKILARNKGIVLLYTGLLVIFGSLFIQNNDIQTDFQNSKPDLAIINHDDGIVATGLVDYLQENAIIKTYENLDRLDDALFYRDLNSIIEIPANFSTDLIAGKHPEVLIRNTGDYNSSFAEILLEKYLQTAQTFANAGMKDNEVVENAQQVLSTGVEVKIQADESPDVDYSRANRYFSFATYSVLACLIYVICLVMSSFKNPNIRRRNLVSATSYKKMNRELFMANCLYALCLWAIYLLLSVVLAGSEAMLTPNGGLYALNLLIFTINAVALAFLISNLVTNREAVSGIVNVVALGSAFLCGSFVPMEWLPDSVLTVAHILPAYWYNSNNTLLAELGIYNLENLWPIILNYLVLIIFTLVFVIINNYISYRKQQRVK